TLEHHGGTARECSAPAGDPGTRPLEPILRMGGCATQCPCVTAGHRVHESGSFDFQYAANLPAGWRPDSSFTTLVRHGTRPEFDGSHYYRLYRRGRVRRARLRDAFHLARSRLLVRVDELLGWIAACARVVMFCKIAPSGGLCLPWL